MKVSDVICKWYIWAVVGYVIGIKLNDTLGGVAGLVIAGGIGWYIQKNHSNHKSENHNPIRQINNL